MVWPEQGPRRNSRFVDPQLGLLSHRPGALLHKSPQLQPAVRAQPHPSKYSSYMQKSYHMLIYLTTVCAKLLSLNCGWHENSSNSAVHNAMLIKPQNNSYYDTNAERQATSWNENNETTNLLCHCCRLLIVMSSWCLFKTHCNSTEVFS